MAPALINFIFDDGDISDMRRIFCPQLSFRVIMFKINL